MVDTGGRPAGTEYDVDSISLDPRNVAKGDSFGLDMSRCHTYEDGHSIDWLSSPQTGSTHRGVSVAQYREQIMDGIRTWFVVIMSGVGIGLAGAWLDVLVKWLADLREGRCTYGFFYNQSLCCSGLDPGELCTEWRPWGQILNVKYIFPGSLLQAAMYIVTAMIFAGSAATLVQSYAPYAFHTGIPEIKAILGGYVLDRFLTPWTLLIKALGLALAVASGLSLGKEGPLVHVACCMAYGLSRLFRQFRYDEGKKRNLLAAAAAAGVSVAFGSPLGGVLFGLEELDTFATDPTGATMWRGFVASAVAAVALQYIDPFGVGKLVLFQVTSGGDVDNWRAFEIIPWIFLGVFGGVFGTLLIRLNIRIAKFRLKHGSVLGEWPILEVIGGSAFTAVFCYLVVFARVQTSELVANLFQECGRSGGDPSNVVVGDYHGLCNPSAIWENVFLLLLTAAMKWGLTAWTFGMMVPAGIFLPTIAIGACVGRAVGMIMQELHRTYPRLWIFINSCPPDPSARCVSPGFYAVIGASSMLGGTTRMTISLVVILFELTGALSHVLPIMISVMTSKWVAESISSGVTGKSTGSIYTEWIKLRQYPWLPPNVEHEFRDGGHSARDWLVERRAHTVTLREGMSIGEIREIANRREYRGYPIIIENESLEEGSSEREDILLGYVIRSTLEIVLSQFEPEQDHDRCSFMPTKEADLVDLSGVLEQGILKLRQEVPQELVVRMFHKMNLHQILFTKSGGTFAGMLTKADIVHRVHGDP